MKSTLSVHSISDTLLKEIKSAIKSVTVGSVEASVQKGLVKKITSKKHKAKKHR